MKYTLPSGNASIEKSSSILSEVDYVYPQSKKDVTQALKEALRLLHSYESSSQQRELDHKRSVLNSVISDVDKIIKEACAKETDIDFIQALRFTKRIIEEYAK